MRSTPTYGLRAVSAILAAAWLSALLPAQAANQAFAPLPDTMRAAAIDHGGDADVLTLHQVPVPKAAPGTVVVAVRTAGVGPWELAMRSHPPDGTQFPWILGSDGAGTVAAIGEGVHGFRLGDAVYGSGDSFYSEFASVRASDLAHLPRGVGMREAGVLAISGLSALQAIDDILQMKAGETLIIHGASGGVGTLALQFAKWRSVRVLATAGDDDALDRLRQLGADAVVNGRSGDIAAAAHRLAPSGVDAVLGLSGGDALEQCLQALRQDGRGRSAYLYGMTPLPKPRYGVRMTLFSYVSGERELRQLNRAVEAAHARIPVAAEFPLQDAAEAHRRLQAGHLFGKILLTIGQ